MWLASEEAEGFEGGGRHGGGGEFAGGGGGQGECDDAVEEREEFAIQFGERFRIED